ETSETLARGTSSVAASSRSTASFARPSSGGSATRIFHASPYRPTIPGRRAPGDTRSLSRVVAACTAFSLALRRPGLGFLHAVVELERRERRAEQRADARRLHPHALQIGERFAPDAACLGVRLLEHDARLAPSLLPQLLGRTLRR